MYTATYTHTSAGPARTMQSGAGAKGRRADILRSLSSQLSAPCRPLVSDKYRHNIYIGAAAVQCNALQREDALGREREHGKGSWPILMGRPANIEKSKGRLMLG